MEASRKRSVQHTAIRSTGALLRTRTHVTVQGPQENGDNRAVEAAKAAISSPLLEISIDGAKGILFTITGGSDLTMYEVSEAAKVITESVDSDAKIIFGAVINEEMQNNDIKVTVVATGFTESALKENLLKVRQQPTNYFQAQPRPDNPMVSSPA